MKQRGSVAAALVYIIILICVIALTLMNWTGYSHENAIKSAHSWAKDLGITASAVQCSNYDSDGDGYVSCTVRSGQTLHMVECGWFANGGSCRQPKTTVRQR